MAVANAVIAGVNRAGTTSLFATLGRHPEVALSTVKETCYFLPLRYGEPLAPLREYEAFFAEAGDASVRLEATPGYFYGGQPVSEALRRTVPGVKVLVVLREPVARCISHFRFQQSRLLLPASLTLDGYLEQASRFDDGDFRDRRNNPWFGVRGGMYADFLPPWLATFGSDLRIVRFEELVASPDETLAHIAEFLGIDPRTFPERGLAMENRATGYRLPGLQRVALAVNDRFEPFWRRHPGLERQLRSAHGRINGRAPGEVSTSAVAWLRESYEDPNKRLAEQLRAFGLSDLPEWLANQGGEAGSQLGRG